MIARNALQTASAPGTIDPEKVQHFLPSRIDRFDDGRRDERRAIVVQGGGGGGAHSFRFFTTLFKRRQKTGLNEREREKEREKKVKNERVNELFYVEVFGLIFMKKSTHFLSEEEQMRTGFERLFRRIRDHILITFVLLFTCSHWNWRCHWRCHDDSDWRCWNDSHFNPRVNLKKS